MPRFDVTSFGETMLRYSVPVGKRLGTLATLDVHVGGAESNALSALACLDRCCAWVSAVADNDLGDAVLRRLQANCIDTSAVVRSADRMGSYYVEFAAAPRPTNVIYDRDASAITNLKSSRVDWDYLLDTRILHLTGITPALSSGCLAIIQEAIRRAKTSEAVVCFDVNYRSKLWTAGQAKNILTPLVHDVDILICGEGDAEAVFGLRGSDETVLNELRQISAATCIVLTQSDRGSSMLYGDDFIRVEARAAEVIDRLGAGDAYAAGFIDGYLDGDVIAGMQRGSLLGALALTQHGDSVTTTREELNYLLNDNTVGVSR